MSFENEVYKKLEALKPGEKLQLDKTHKNYDRFVETVKEYMSYGKYYNGLEFTNNYETVRRLEWIPTDTTEAKTAPAHTSK
jgi:hypothetical protein